MMGIRGSIGLIGGWCDGGRWAMDIIGSIGLIGGWRDGGLL